MSEEYSKNIKMHYEECWGAKCERIAVTEGPIWDLPKDFLILRFPPREVRTMWTYATQCMSQPGDSVPLELHMFTDTKRDEVAEILVATAHYHRTGKRLGLGHTVNFGQPWLPGSRADHGLLSRPYLDGPKLEFLQLDPGRVRFLWLIPVTSSEVQFAQRCTVEELEERFEATKFDYLDPLRPPVA